MPFALKNRVFKLPLKHFFFKIQKQYRIESRNCSNNNHAPNSTGSLGKRSVLNNQNRKLSENE
jgi:hypothetical protein